MNPYIQQPDSPPLDAEYITDAVQSMRVDDRRLSDLRGKHDWTRDLPKTLHLDLFYNTDWNRNGLGPFEDWSDTLQLFTGFVLADSRAACLWWGPDAIAIYNEHFAPMCAQVHPALMGSTYAQGFPELWPAIGGLFNESRRTGIGQNVSSTEPLLIERNGWREEAFFSGSFVPIGPAHQPLGFYNSVYEVTEQKLADRRTSMLNLLASVSTPTVDAVFSQTLDILDTNPRDIPFAMLYRCGEGAGSTTLQLQGYSGLPKGHNLLVDSVTIESNEGLISDLRQAGSELVYIDYDDRFDSASWKGWGSPSEKIAILPLMKNMDIFGYLVVGTNPYRPFNDKCRQFISDLYRMVSAGISSAIDFELSKRRQDQLEADLAFSDLKLRHLISHASVGMCHLALDGEMLWANDHYYRLAGVSLEEHHARYAFLDAYLDEDRPKADEVWSHLLAGVEFVSADLRLKRKYSTPSGEEEPAQIQVLAFPYRDPETGQVKSIMACTTDISRLKWAQDFHARSAAEAREAKRQQEAFIDVVSHEMRNPLSAIVHCADAIAVAAEECQNKTTETGFPALFMEALSDILQSARIILQCAHHQKRIIDDVLTLSKLDSMLLSITPALVKPRNLVDSIVSIFEAELRTHLISCSVTDDPSLLDLAVDQVYLDSSRVTQIFINLLTNAIKFVKSSNERRISIRFGASKASPRNLFPEDTYWATSDQDGDITNSPEWGTGEEMFLTFAVQDSGIGLEEQDIAKIFGRFRQASVKTSVQYGGSGLGLFISKKLTEKQGGQIGVSSVHGKGSTFGFYVKTRRGEKQQPPPITAKISKSVEILGNTPEQLSVLLVEDNMINQQVLSRQLKKARCVVAVANHGLEALQILEKTTFDVVLMDSEMPILDGLAATRAIRQKELAGEGLLGQTSTRAGARLPIIAVTANVRKEQIDAAIAAGSDCVMPKPFKAAELVQLMKSLVLQMAPPKNNPA